MIELIAGLFHGGLVGAVLPGTADDWDLVQGGVAGALLMFVVGFATGRWRTPQEVDAHRQVAADLREQAAEWRARSETTDKQIDLIVPALNTLSGSVEKQADALERLTTMVGVLERRIPGGRRSSEHH